MAGNEHDPVEGEFPEDEVVEEYPAQEVVEVDEPAAEEVEYEYVDPSELRTGVPGWVVALVALLSLAVGAGAMLMSGLTREDLLASDTEDASPIATTICSGSANVRSTASLTGDVVDTLDFGDEVAGMLSGGWVKLAEGRYVSVSVLCDLAPAGTDLASTTTTVTEETSETTASSTTTEETVTQTQTQEPEPTGDGRIPGTFDASGTGSATLELPEDARRGVVTFEHTGDGTFTLAGTDGTGAATATPALTVDGDYSGAVVFGVAGDVPVLTVDGGTWTVHVAPLDTAPEMVDGVGATSTAAFRLGEEPGRWRFEPTAPATLVQYAPDGTTASADVTGPSEVELMGGGTYLVVYTAGEWTADQVTDAPAPDDEATTGAP